MNAIMLAAVLLMSGATEASQATEATEATDATGATEATETTDATEATEANEANESTEATEATEATTNDTEATEVSILDQYIAEANETSFTEFAKNCSLKPEDKRGGCGFLQGFLHSDDCKKEGAKKMEKAHICAAE